MFRPWKMKTKTTSIPPWMWLALLYCFCFTFHRKLILKMLPMRLLTVTFTGPLSDLRGYTPQQHWHDLDAKPLNAHVGWLINYTSTGKVRLSYFFFHYFRQKKFLFPCKARKWASYREGGRSGRAHEKFL